MNVIETKRHATACLTESQRLLIQAVQLLAIIDVTEPRMMRASEGIAEVIKELQP